MKLTRQQMAGIAFALLLVAVVVLQFVGGEAAHDLSARLEGALGMALMAFVGETAASRGNTGGPTSLLIGGIFAICVGALVMTGCGGAQKVTACQITNAACAACEAARQTYCGGPEVEVEAPAIQRDYPGDET